MSIQKIVFVSLEPDKAIVVLHPRIIEPKNQNQIELELLHAVQNGILDTFVNEGRGKQWMNSL